MMHVPLPTIQVLLKYTTLNYIYNCLDGLHLLIKLLLGDLPTLELLQQPTLFGKVSLILMQLACPSLGCWQALLHLLAGDLFGCPHLLCQLLLSLQLLHILFLTSLVLVLQDNNRGVMSRQTATRMMLQDCSTCMMLSPWLRSCTVLLRCSAGQVCTGLRSGKHIATSTARCFQSSCSVASDVADDEECLRLPATPSCLDLCLIGQLWRPHSHGWVPSLTFTVLGSTVDGLKLVNFPAFLTSAILGSCSSPTAIARAPRSNSSSLKM